MAAMEIKYVNSVCTEMGDPFVGRPNDAKSQRSSVQWEINNLTATMKITIVLARLG